MKTSSKFLFTLITLISFSSATGQNPGDLDPNLNGSGTRYIDISGGSDIGTNVLQQTDGKIIITGSTSSGTSFDFSISRLNPDGSPDNTFSYNGLASTMISTTQAVSYNSVLQQDGKILLCGFSPFSGVTKSVFVRYNSDGTLDNSFGNSGISIISVGTQQLTTVGIALQADGKIIASGTVSNGLNADLMVMRLDPDGALDQTFGVGGISNTGIPGSDDVSWDVAIQPDGKIVAVGTTENAAFDHEIIVARFYPDGTIDTDFGNSGITIIEFGTLENEGYAVSILENGKILVAGSADLGTPTVMAVAQLLPDGSLDINFGTNGKQTISSLSGTVARGNDMCVQQDGKIIVIGDSRNGLDEYFAVARLNSDGAIDNTFGSSGRVETEFGGSGIGYSAVMQSDGLILASGRAMGLTSIDFVLARYISGVNIGIGEVDAYLGSTLIYPNPILNNEVVMEYELKTNQRVSIELFDLTGKKITILQTEKEEAIGKHQKRLTLPNVNAGQYILRLNAEKGSVSVKVILEK